MEVLRYYDTLVTVYKFARSLIREEREPLPSSFKKQPDHILYIHPREILIVHNIKQQILSFADRASQYIYLSN